MSEREALLDRMLPASLSTPARMRAWSVLLVALIAGLAVVLVLSVDRLEADADRIQDSTGPVLITSQGLVASLAEADAANTAVFLSGDIEDRRQRRLYEQAVGRAPEQIEQISARIGSDDVAHEALQALGSQLVTYSGLVERARLGNQQNLDGAVGDLSASVALVGGEAGMLSEVAIVTERAQQALDDDISVAFLSYLGLILLIVVLIVLLVVAQRWLTKRTRRTLNLPLVLATLLIGILAVWMIAAPALRSADFDEAQDRGYSSIAATAALQAETFGFKTQESTAVITGVAMDNAARQNRLSQVEAQIGRVRSLADSDRERAAVDELQVRWQRYLEASDAINDALIADDVSGATQLAITAGNGDFNGLNTAIESVLLDNRDQFNEAIESAAARLDYLVFGTVVIALLASACVLFGYQRRINEYW